MWPLECCLATNWRHWYWRIYLDISSDRKNQQMLFFFLHCGWCFQQKGLGKPHVCTWQSSFRACWHYQKKNNAVSTLQVEEGVYRTWHMAKCIGMVLYKHTCTYVTLHVLKCYFQLCAFHFVLFEFSQCLLLSHKPFINRIAEHHHISSSSTVTV